MTIVLNTARTMPSGPDTAFTITRPAGCTPPSTPASTAQYSFDVLDLGALGAAPKGCSLRLIPTTAGGGHVGIAFNLFGNQPITPPVFGAGVGLWTYANGLIFADDNSIKAESWHVDPGTNEASGVWFDAYQIGTWVKGHEYQVDVAMYADGHYTYRVLDLTYTLSSGSPDPNRMVAFFSTLASPSDPTLSTRIRAKSTNGRTNKLAVFLAGAGCAFTVTPYAIYN